MSPLSRTMQNVQAAQDLPAILAAARLAFDAALAEIRARQDPASPMFAALVMAAAPAADGRDIILTAASLPWSAAGPPIAGIPRDEQGAGDTGDLADVFRALQSRLEAGAGLATNSRDLVACRGAVQAARRAGDLLAGGPR